MLIKLSHSPVKDQRNPGVGTGPPEEQVAFRATPHNI